VSNGLPLVEVEHLVLHYPIRGGLLARKLAEVHAVDDVSLTIPVATEDRAA
jgi:ABC-type oligopeptide transport system ATPase subunit